MILSKVSSFPNLDSYQTTYMGICIFLYEKAVCHLQPFSVLFSNEGASSCIFISRRVLKSQALKNVNELQIDFEILMSFPISLCMLQ